MVRAFEERRRASEQRSFGGSLDGDRLREAKSGAAPGSGPAADVVAGPAMSRDRHGFIAAFAIGSCPPSSSGASAAWDRRHRRLPASTNRRCIDVNWATVESQTGLNPKRIKSQTDSFSKFITGLLPSGTSAAAGLWSGFRLRVSI
ncbi:MAG: hypothetical protein U0575_13700 [Phycisphaerales bacterium]